MEDDKVLQTLKELLIDNLGIDDDMIVLESSFTDDLGMDSLDLVEGIIGAEVVFDIAIPDEDAEQIITVQDAVIYLHSRVSY